MSRHLLIGGSGASGVVYAKALSRGGDVVCLHLRPKYVEALRQRPWLFVYDLNYPWMLSWLLDVLVSVCCLLFYMFVQNSSLVEVLVFCVVYLLFSRVLPGFQLSAPLTTIHDFQISSSVTEAKAFAPDFVWLCISSTALAENGGAWLRELLSALGAFQADSRIAVVNLLPFPADAHLLTSDSVFPFPQRIIDSVTMFIAFQTPLPQESFHCTDIRIPGVALFTPPFTVTPFKGDKQMIIPLLNTLRRGGFACRYTSEAVGETIVLPASLIQTFTLSLLNAHWKSSSLRASPSLLRLFCASTKEYIQFSLRSQRLKGPPHWLLAILFSVLEFPWLMAVVLLAAPRVLPFDLDAYMRYHFGYKHQQQQIDNLTNVLQKAKELEAKHSALEALMKIYERNTQQHTPTPATSPPGIAPATATIS